MARDASETEMRLLDLSHGAGCACKLGMEELKEVLYHLSPTIDTNILVDTAHLDDAAVYRLSEHRALVLTTDFFPPVVDSPFDFGRIAAANALSDIYAMGGCPLLALSLVGFPRRLLGQNMLGSIVEGAQETCRAAGIAILGGHSIDDAEPKFGLVVAGTVSPERVLRNSGAAVGDILVLTKPLGSGIVTTAMKAGAAPRSVSKSAVDVMTSLNRGAAEALKVVGASAGTDISGYGLLGHLRSLLRASGVAAVVDAKAVPLIDGSSQLAVDGHVPGGTRRNLLDLSGDVSWPDGVPMELQLLLADAQTSGGLLVSLPQESVDSLLSECLRRGTVGTVIGEVVGGSPGTIRVTFG